jgi:UPF0042 nucleotide-binding protein
MRATVVSFGYKYGLPVDADLVVDCRFLPNPHWVPELRPLTGRDEQVRDYVLSRPGAQEFLDRYTEILAILVEGYQREGKRFMTLAVGCTGGKHRSVAIAEQLAARLEALHPTYSTRGHATRAGVPPRDPIEVQVTHRDLGRE